MNYYTWMRFPGGKPKAVTFSYDDGVRHDIKFSEIINRYGIKCTFNINSDFFGNDTTSSHLTVDEVKKYLIGTGHEIAVHGADHKAPGSVRPIVGIKDVLYGRLGLEEKFGGIIRGMAYPDSGITLFRNGSDYEDIKRYLKDLGIVYSRTLSGDNDRFEMPTDWYAWMPTAHHRNPRVLEYANKFVGLDLSKMYISAQAPKLFYLWGHSYEFANNNEWDLLENICDVLGGREDIWYATNMEIYEYTEAYNSLVFSADDTIVYNPSLMEVWFTVNGNLYSVKSGETKKLY